jgi:hypothetical protein
MQAKFVYEALDSKTKLTNKLIRKIHLVNNTFVNSFNRKTKQKWQETLRDFDNDIRQVRSHIAFDFVWAVAKLVGLEPVQGDWLNSNKNPDNHFQIECWTYLDPNSDKYSVNLRGMIYIDDNNNVNLYRSSLSMYDEEYEDIADLIVHDYEAESKSLEKIYDKKYSAINKKDPWFWFQLIQNFNKKTNQNLKKLSTLNKCDVEFSLTKDLAYIICKKLKLNIDKEKIVWKNEEDCKKDNWAYHHYGIQFELKMQDEEGYNMLVQGDIYFGENFEIYITASEFRILHYGWHVIFAKK